MSDLMQSPIFAQRKVEANILKHVYETLIDSHGEDVAKKTIADAVRSASIAARALCWIVSSTSNRFAPRGTSNAPPFSSPIFSHSWNFSGVT